MGLDMYLYKKNYVKNEEDEHNGTYWNYDDFSDTFTIIKTLE